MLAFLFSGFLCHGFLPSSLIESCIIPLVKNKSGDIRDEDNYRPIALATVVSKVFERIILSRIEVYLYTSENQFGFKPHVGTETCIYFLKEIVNFYLQNSTPV